ncbi:MAG: YjbH domain-containing protein [Pseudomonadota bacterium]
MSGHLRIMSMLAALCALQAAAQTVSTLGTPGLIDMPTAEVFEDGEVALTTLRFGGIQRNTATVQIFPRIHGSFRYAIIDDFDQGGARDRFDRSFDIHFQIADETPRSPALAVGLRDFAGTGLLSSEYIVATKTVGRAKLTGGLGWGRLAERGSFDNPLGLFAERFETRPSAGAGGISTTGQLDFGLYFRGPMAVFGGLDYQVTDRLSLQVEYSSDAYAQEEDRDVIDIESPINLGMNYRFPSGSNVRAHLIGGTEIGLQYTYLFNPKRRPIPGGREGAPLTVPDARAARLADLPPGARETQAAARAALVPLLAEEGITLEGLSLERREATVRIENGRWDVEAQAIGRTARVLANVLPAGIESFTIVPQTFGVANTAITLNRSDLRELQTDFDGAWKSLARARIEDAPEAGRAGEVPGLYPELRYGIAPYSAFSLFDPDQPVRIAAGLELSLGLSPRPGLSFNALTRYPLVDTIEEASRRSDSVLPRVRSDAVLYALESEFEINQLYGQYLFRPGGDLFGRVSAGYLETMFAGLSGEVLWSPNEGPLALGVELNYARQRDFDMLFGLQDYDVVTGHASAYYDFGSGYLGQLDVGRYLAGDWGATFSLDREYNNGFRIGAYFTLTDVPFEEFGEGSFDKGIRFTVPLSWITGEPSRGAVSQLIQPVLRDGGARLSVPNRLHGVTRSYRAQSLAKGWGRVFR